MIDYLLKQLFIIDIFIKKFTFKNYLKLYFYIICP
jgi:hypothetical protein